MKLYFSSPVALITAYGIFSQKLTKAIFVQPHNRGNEGNKTHRDLTKQLQKISQVVAKALGIEFSEIQFSEYLRVQPEIIESSLMINSNCAKGIIINGSDSYCIFGFKNYFNFSRTKLKLIRLFKRNFKIHSSATLYYYKQVANNLKTSNKVINTREVGYLLSSISPKVFASIGQNVKSSINKDCILVLPPICKYSGREFSLKFMQRVESIANERNLKVFIKPHRNDEMKYSDFFTDKSLIIGEKLDLRFVPVEFFFTLNHVKTIVAVPSSSLALAQGILTQVLVPKNRQLFRRSFLDQLPFLYSIGLKFERI